MRSFPFCLLAILARPLRSRDEDCLTFRSAFIVGETDLCVGIDVGDLTASYLAPVVFYFWYGLVFTVRCFTLYIFNCVEGNGLNRENDCESSLQRDSTAS